MTTLLRWLRSLACHHTQTAPVGVAWSGDERLGATHNVSVCRCGAVVVQHRWYVHGGSMTHGSLAPFRTVHRGAPARKWVATAISWRAQRKEALP